MNPVHNIISKVGYTLLVLGLLIVIPAHAVNRIALVVGNDNYQNVVSLKKAVNDANTISQTLTQLGFTVILATDTTRRGFNQKLQEFTSRIEAGDVAMLYYAGHSIEISGQNFLLPVDIPKAEPGQEDFVRSESVGLQTVLARLRTKKAKLNIVVLDACRNNPFATSGSRGIGGTRGLAGITAPQGTFILYSADAGEAALDRLNNADSNPNSVFTRTLVPMMLKPGMNLPAMAREVRRSVSKLAKTVSHEQTPAYYDAMFGDFYFTGNVIINQPGTSAQITTQTTSEKGQYERDFWKAVEASPSQEMYQAYLTQYPDGNFSLIAKIKLKQIQSNAPTPAAPTAKKKRTVKGVTQTESGLKYSVIESGNKDSGTPSSTDTVVVHYRGTLIDGTEFDSSYARGRPSTFSLNRVIPGWIEVLQLMRPGDKWSVVIPPELAYGELGAEPVIGPQATLIFEIKLLEIK